MPWKNGGGMTTEIAKGGKSSVDQDWGWRVSMADVATDGPFSIFSGIDRSITVIEGAGMDLHYPDGRKTRLDLNSVVDFDGGEALDGKLRDGPIKDFNVLVDRFFYGADLKIFHGELDVEVSSAGKSNLLVHLLDGTGRLQIDYDRDEIDLSSQETLCIHSAAPGKFKFCGEARIAIAHIWELPN